MRILTTRSAALAALAMCWWIGGQRAAAQVPPACTPASIALCSISFNESVMNVPAATRTELGLHATNNPVDVPRIAHVIPDNGTLASPPVVFLAGGQGSTAAGNQGLGIHTVWPQAVVVYLEAGKLTDHGGEWKLPADAEFGETCWSPRYPHTEPSAKHTDLWYLQTVILSSYFTFSFNPAQMFLAGHSSGGFFTLGMRALMPEIFRAYALVGAYGDYRSPGQDDLPAVVASGQQSPAKPVMYIMGDDEDVFPWSPAVAGADDRVHRTIRQLTAMNGAAVPAQEDRAYLTTLVNTMRARAPAARMVQTTFAPVKTNGAEVVFAVYGGDHSWPPRDAEDPSLSASAWVVQFFQRHMAALPNAPSVLFEQGWTVPVLMAPVIQ